jgi:hypothetical protein
VETVKIGTPVGAAAKIQLLGLILTTWACHSAMKIYATLLKNGSWHWWAWQLWCFWFDLYDIFIIWMHLSFCHTFIITA